MKFKKRSKFSIVILIICMALVYISGTCCVCVAENLDKQLKKHEQQYDELRKKIAGTKKKVSESRKKEKKVVYQIDVINKRITDTRQKVAVVSKDIKKVEGNIDVLNHQVEQIKQRIAKCRQYLSKRIISMYKYGNVYEFNLLLSGTGAQTAMDNFYLLNKIAKQDQKVIHELYEQINALGIKQNELGKQKDALKNKNHELAVQHNQLKVAVNEKEIALKQIQKEKAEYIAQQKEFEKAAKELQGTIKKLIAAKRAKDKGKQTTTAYYKGGRLLWPVQGRITSNYGIRIHPVFKTKTKHSGIDIAAVTGTPVASAAAGEVLFAGKMRGYGNVVIIDHGNDLTTVYGHLSTIECSEGQQVAKGGIIGKVGMTGIATGPHLHFEVRVNGNTVDPMTYLR